MQFSVAKKGKNTKGKINEAPEVLDAQGAPWRTARSILARLATCISRSFQRSTPALGVKGISLI